MLSNFVLIMSWKVSWMLAPDCFKWYQEFSNCPKKETKQQQQKHHKIAHPEVVPLSQGRVWTRLREALSTASPSTWSEDLRALLVSSLCPLPRHGAGTQNLLFVPYHELNHKACSRPIFPPPLLSKQISFCFCFDFKRKTFWSKICTLPHQRMSVFFGGKKKTNRKTKQNKTTLKPNCWDTKEQCPIGVLCRNIPTAWPQAWPPATAFCLTAGQFSSKTPIFHLAHFAGHPWAAEGTC